LVGQQSFKTLHCNMISDNVNIKYETFSSWSISTFGWIFSNLRLAETKITFYPTQPHKCRKYPEDEGSSYFLWPGMCFANSTYFNPIVWHIIGINWYQTKYPATLSICNFTCILSKIYFNPIIWHIIGINWSLDTVYCYFLLMYFTSISKIEILNKSYV